MDPATNYDTYFVPQGIGADLIATIEGFTREDVDALRGALAGAGRQGAGRAATSPSPSSRSRTSTASPSSTTTSSSARAPRSRRSASSTPSFAAIGEMGGFDAVALQKYHWVEKIDHVHTPATRSGIVDGAALVLVGNEQTGKDLGLTPAARILATAVSGADPTIMLTGPAPAAQEGARARPA